MAGNGDGYQQGYQGKMEELLKDWAYRKVKKDATSQTEHKLKVLLKSTDWPDQMQTRRYDLPMIHN